MPCIRPLFLAFCLMIVLPLHGAITASIEQRSVTARGLTPGGGAVFFSVAHEPHLAYHSVKRMAKYVADADKDGVVSVTTAAEVPWKSVWFVVDAATGRYVVGSREDSSDRVTGERRSRPDKDANGEAARLIHERPWLELLVIRPGGDVWELTAMRGGAADTEKRGQAEFATSVSLFRPVTPDARPLVRLTRGDVVIAIDADTVEYFVVGVE